MARREASEGKVLLETARRESSEAVNLSERLSEECRGLRTDLHQLVSMVAQRDEVIRQLRDQAVLSGLLDGSLFNGKRSRVPRSGFQLLSSQRRGGGGIYLCELFSRARYSCLDPFSFFVIPSPWRLNSRTHPCLPDIDPFFFFFFLFFMYIYIYTHFILSGLGSM